MLSQGHGGQKQTSATGAESATAIGRLHLRQIGEPHFGQKSRWTGSPLVPVSSQVAGVSPMYCSEPMRSGPLHRDSRPRGCLKQQAGRRSYKRALA
jgi:hypothetical protein